MNAYRSKQKEYTAILRELEPQIIDSAKTESSKRTIYERLNTEVEPLGLNDKAHRFATQKDFRVPELPFGIALIAAEEILFNKLDNERRASEKAEFNKQREESRRSVAA